MAPAVAVPSTDEGAARFRARGLEPALFVLGLLASIGLAWLSWHWESRQRASEIQEAVEVRAQALDETLRHLADAVQTLAQFYAASGAVSAEAFGRYTQPTLQRHLRLGDLVETVLARLPEQPLDLVLRDADLAGDDGVLHVRWSPTRTSAHPPLPVLLTADAQAYEVPIVVGGRHLLLRGVPTDGIGPRVAVPLVLFLLGLGATSALTGLVWFRRRAGRRLRASEARLRRALDAAGMVAWEYDPATLRVTLSDNAEAVLEMPGRHTTSTEGYDLIHPDDVAQHRALVTGAITSGEGYLSVYRLKGRDPPLWLEEHGRAVVDAAGGTGQLVGVVQNITGRKASEETLRRYQQIVETAGEMLVFVDRELRYRLVNPAYARLYQTTPEALQGRRVAEIVSPEVQGQLLPRLRAALAGESCTIALHGQDRAGRRRWSERHAVTGPRLRRDHRLCRYQ